MYQNSNFQIQYHNLLTKRDQKKKLLTAAFFHFSLAFSLSPISIRYVLLNETLDKKDITHLCVCILLALITYRRSGTIKILTFCSHHFLRDAWEKKYTFVWTF